MFNQPFSIVHDDQVYTFNQLEPFKWRFDFLNLTLEHTTDIDLREECGTDEQAWVQYLEQAMQDADLIVYSEHLECYVPAHLQEDWEREDREEAAAWAEHYRMERTY